MSNLDDIFDLPEGQTAEPKKEKKERKKAEMSDEKKAAMLERLRAGREKRQENLKAKKEPKEEPKQAEVIISEKKDTVPKITKGSTDNKQSSEAERLSFINMMAGKSKPNQTEKFERPKKKVQSAPEEKPKIETKKDEVKQIPPPIIAPVLPANVALVREPVVIRNFKKPMWA